jgi:hypothetical protein
VPSDMRTPNCFILNAKIDFCDGSKTFLLPPSQVSQQLDVRASKQRWKRRSHSTTSIQMIAACCCSKFLRMTHSSRSLKTLPVTSAARHISTAAAEGERTQSNDSLFSMNFYSITINFPNLIKILSCSRSCRWRRWIVGKSTGNREGVMPLSSSSPSSLSRGVTPTISLSSTSAGIN